MQRCIVVARNTYTSLHLDAAEPPIAYRYTESYAHIWDDGGSGAYKDVSIWRPISYQAGFYPLGDTAVATHSKPSVISITVKELKPGSLIAPTGFQEMWNDRGSGARGNVRILRMTAPFGYSCLGHVAIDSYSQLPDKNKYRYISHVDVCTHMY